MQENHKRNINRMNSAPPDYNGPPQSDLNDFIKSDSRLNISANEFVPGSLPLVPTESKLIAVDKGWLNPDVRVFVPSNAIINNSNILKPNAPAFSPSSLLPPNAPEFIPSSTSLKFQHLTNQDINITEIYELKDESEDSYTLVCNRELSKDEISESITIDDINIKVDDRIRYNFDEFNKIRVELESLGEFNTITDQLLNLSERKIYQNYKKRDNKRHDSKKNSRKERE